MGMTRKDYSRISTSQGYTCEAVIEGHVCGAPASWQKNISLVNPDEAHWLCNSCYIELPGQSELQELRAQRDRLLKSAIWLKISLRHANEKIRKLEDKLSGCHAEIESLNCQRHRAREILAR